MSGVGWIGLTDSEINAIVITHQPAFQAARAVEALLMAKNSQCKHQEPAEQNGVSDLFKKLNAEKREARRKFGMPCPNCTVRLPKSNPKILMPNQTCWCGYEDRRPRASKTGGGLEY